MAEDADGNYYYEEGTIAEQFDKWDVYEDSDGNVGLLTNGSELRFHEVAHVFGAERANPDTDELAQGEKMLYVSDGSGSNSTSGDVVVARNNGDSIEEAVISLTYNEV